MALSDDFKTFAETLPPDNISDMEITVGNIAKKLNKVYYELDGEKSEHMYIVGSIGRGTAIKGVSDLDILFDLSSEVYSKYNAYETNGQSALLQEVKNVLKERYPKTKMRGDGQVVVIELTNYTVELVPGFKLSNDSFEYPDTNEGGSWENTNPLPEIETSHNTSDETDNNFTYICNMLRAWRNNIGFKFGGLLIDTLVYNFLNENEDYKVIDFVEYFDMTKSLFEYLKGLNKEQSYWDALGSNQEVYNCDKGKFIDKAKKAYNKISSYDGSESDINSKLREIFGDKFPEVITVSKSAYELASKKTEQFISNLFPVDIQNSLNIDCEVTQDGFRPFMLRIMLNNNTLLPINKSLKFSIKECDVEGDYDIYWKVKNVGSEALRLDNIRGQIKKTNSTEQIEKTSFRGSHFVECYIVKNGICVAKDKIDVPIL